MVGKLRSGYGLLCRAFLSLGQLHRMGRKVLFIGTTQWAFRLPPMFSINSVDPALFMNEAINIENVGENVLNNPVNFCASTHFRENISLLNHNSIALNQFHNNVPLEWDCFAMFFPYSIWLIKYFAEDCYSRITLLWIWVLLFHRFLFLPIFNIEYFILS